MGLRCVASAVLDEEGQPLAALSVSGPSARIDETAMSLIGGLVRHAATVVTELVGGQPKHWDQKQITGSSRIVELNLEIIEPAGKRPSFSRGPQ